MRSIVFALAIGLSAIITQGASAFEIEDQRKYAAQDPQSVLRIISTADIDAFQPLILAFQAQYPTIDVDYTVASSTQLMIAMQEREASFDLAISSAMDLQTKLANDGLVQTYKSSITDDLPQWSKWRDQLFAFTQEPAALVISDAAFGNLTVPKNRAELIELLRSNPVKFDGRVGTYDVRTSGTGYLFATQDSRNTDNFWRLTEVMGRLNAKLYCCSSNMIDDVASQRLVLAYNVLGSYAESRIKVTEGISIVQLQDFNTVMMRTALIPETAENIEAAGQMIDFLVQPSTQSKMLQLTGLPAIGTVSVGLENVIRPIRLGPGLLVFLDKLKREAFLETWEDAIVQE